MADLFSERRSKTTRSPYLVGNKTLNATFANQMKTNLVLTLAAASAVLAASSAPCAGQARHRAHRQPSTLQAKPESSRLGKIPPLPRRRPTKKGENEKNAKERNAKESGSARRSQPPPASPRMEAPKVRIRKHRQARGSDWPPQRSRQSRQSLGARTRYLRHVRDASRFLRLSPPKSRSVQRSARALAERLTPWWWTASAGMFASQCALP